MKVADDMSIIDSYRRIRSHRDAPLFYDEEAKYSDIIVTLIEGTVTGLQPTALNELLPHGSPFQTVQ
jgi:hypothetical protein